METLSELGRTWICRKLKMNCSGDSIFIKDKNAFVDRMTLLNTKHNISGLVKSYKEELAKFESEEYYNEFLNEACENIKIDISKKTGAANLLNNILCKIYNYRNVLNTNVGKEFNTLVNTDNYIRIYFEYPFYESFKYLLAGLNDIPNDVDEYIKENTSSIFLSKESDIDIFLDNYSETYNVLKHNMLLISYSLFGLISPTFINEKEAKIINETGVTYVTSANKPIRQLDNIVEALKANNEINLTNVSIEIFTLKHILKDSNIVIKENIICRDNKEIINATPYEEIQLLRYLRGEKESKYDKYFELNGQVVKLQTKSKLNLI